MFRTVTSAALLALVATSPALARGSSHGSHSSSGSHVSYSTHYTTSYHNSVSVKNTTIIHLPAAPKATSTSTKATKATPQAGTMSKGGNGSAKGSGGKGSNSSAGGKGGKGSGGAGGNWTGGPFVGQCEVWRLAGGAAELRCPDTVDGRKVFEAAGARGDDISVIWGLMQPEGSAARIRAETCKGYAGPYAGAQADCMGDYWRSIVPAEFDPAKVAPRSENEAPAGWKYIPLPCRNARCL